MKYTIPSLAAIVAAVMFLFSPPPVGNQDWTAHTVQQGGKDYKPGHGLGFQKMTDGFDLSVVIDSSSWYNPDTLGSDATDWLKAGGVSYLNLTSPALWPKNHLSALVGFRMLPDSSYETAAYVNYEDGGFEYGLTAKVVLGDTVTYKYRYRDGAAWFNLHHEKMHKDTSFSKMPYARYQVSVGPWHGGTAKAPKQTTIKTKLTHIYR